MTIEFKVTVYAVVTGSHTILGCSHEVTAEFRLWPRSHPLIWHIWEWPSPGVWSCTKILLTLRMQPVPITLNYSVKNIWDDVQQKIIIYIYIWKIAIEHISVGLAHAHPNKTPFPFNIAPEFSYLVIVPHSNSNLLILVRVGCTYSVWTARGCIHSVRARNIAQDVSREPFHHIAAWQRSVTGTTSIRSKVFTFITNSRTENINTGNASSPEISTLLWKWVLTDTVLLWTVSLLQRWNVMTGVRRVWATADTIWWVSLGYNKSCLKPLKEHSRINVLSYYEQLLCNVYIVALQSSPFVTWERHLRGSWAEITCTRWWLTLVQRIGTGGELALSWRTATEVKSKMFN